MSGSARLKGDFAQFAAKCLKDITNLLEKHEIRYCLDGGTLLGIVREGRLLPWDNDIDLFAPNTEAKKLRQLKWLFWLKGYKISEKIVREERGPLKSGELRIFKIKSRKFYFRKQRLLVDIIVKYPEGDQYHWIVGEKTTVHKSVDRRFYDNLDTIEFDGKKYPIPCDVEEYLTSRYGDWKTPVKEWNFKQDDLAARS